MENKSKRAEIVDMLIKNERSMQELYEVYADKLALYRDFWKNIAKDEESHATWINTLYAKMKNGLVDFAENRFPAEAIEEFIKRTEEKKKEAQGGEVTLLEALENAVRIERGLLENKFFEVFKGDSLEIEIILEALRMGTENHLREVERVWKKEKGGADYEKQSS